MDKLKVQINEKGKGLSPVIDWSKQPVDFWSNSTYFACAYYNHCGEVGLISIRRHDWKPCSDWRDKQEIKNQIVGAKWEAAELYPAESRIQDRGNWYHLWVMPKGERYSFGFIEGEVSRSDKPVANEVQRPLAQRGDTTPLRHIGHFGSRAATIASRQIASAFAQGRQQTKDQ